MSDPSEEILQFSTGKKIEHCWFSDHSVLYLEVGKQLHSRKNNVKHEQTIFLGYDWQLLTNQISFHRHQRQDDTVKNMLVGATILDLEVLDNELAIALSGGSRLVSLSSFGEAPSWDVSLANQYLFVKNDNLVVDAH